MTDTTARGAGPPGKVVHVILDKYGSHKHPTHAWGRSPHPQPLRFDHLSAGRRSLAPDEIRQLL